MFGLLRVLPREGEPRWVGSVTTKEDITDEIKRGKEKK